MKRTLVAVGLGLALVVGAGIYVLTTGATAPNSVVMPEDVDIAVGETLYAESCAVCHGANLEGQEDWRSPGEDGIFPAPPHDETGHTWHHSDKVLFEYTKLGGRALMAAQGMEFDSGMPGFGDQLSDQDIWNILGYIKSTWPERIKDIQAERSLADG